VAGTQLHTSTLHSFLLPITEKYDMMKMKNLWESVQYVQ
jgi:hypothetical protein